MSAIATLIAVIIGAVVIAILRGSRNSPSTREMVLEYGPLAIGASLSAGVLVFVLGMLLFNPPLHLPLWMGAVDAPGGTVLLRRGMTDEAVRDRLGPASGFDPAAVRARGYFDVPEKRGGKALRLIFEKGALRRMKKVRVGEIW